MLNNQEPLTTLIFPNMYKNMLMGYEVLKFNPDNGNAFIV
jgi:hypothetical protein